MSISNENDSKLPSSSTPAVPSSSSSSSRSITSIGRLSLLPDVLLPPIWRYLDVYDHVLFRRSCHYLYNQSSNRHDVGPLYGRYTVTILDLPHYYPAIAKLRPYSLYHLVPGGNTDAELLLSSITTLRELYTAHIPADVLATQTGLTLLHCARLQPPTSTLVHLKELNIRDRFQLTDYHFIPPSVTSLKLPSVSPLDDAFALMMQHLPQVESFNMIINEEQQMDKELLPLSQWHSLKSLELRNTDIVPTIFDELVHPGIPFPCGASSEI
jgi:hypothetical protein